MTKNFIYLVCCCLQEAFNGRNWSESQHCIQQSSINYIDSEYSLDLEDEFESMDTTPSEAQKNTVEYISGYIVRKLKNSLDCKTCLEYVLSNVPRDDPSLIVRKDRGGLIYQGKDIVKICEITEKKIIEASHTNDVFTKKNILHLLCVKVVSVIPTQFPDTLSKCNHQSMHKYNVLKKICVFYAIIRLKYLKKENNNDAKKSRLRKKHTKIILFQNQ